MSLRARLLLGLILVAALGLVAADVVVYGQVESFLTAQLDQQAVTALNPLIRQINVLSGPGNGFGGLGAGLEFNQATPSGAYGAVVTGGAISKQVFPTPLAARPAIPTDIVSKTDASTQMITIDSNQRQSLYLTVSAVGDPSYRYRLVAVSLTSPLNSVAIVALPLSGVEAVLHRLVGVDLVASAAVLALLAGLGYLVVRVGMRPLEEIEETAEAIAAGDLSRRVVRDDIETEVGRLGASLNSMLGQIEHAFSEQQASEHRLRQFLADASHELRTPVTSIRGYSELFRRGADRRPEDLALAMRRIEDEATRMGVLVDDLLLLARLDQGRAPELGTVDLVAVATDAAADAQVVAPDRPVTLDAPEPVEVTGDERQLLQIATNLVQNALRHTPAGTPVTVSVTARDGHAVLAVRDEGPGMTAEHAARVFERFYRADPSRTRGSGGTGLGLSIVRSIAEAHGGLARVETSPGSGATFVVELPLATGAGEDDPARIRPEVAVGVPEGDTVASPHPEASR
jgi:two-component system OmpR family sensor kinase